MPIPNRYVTFVSDRDFLECVRWVCDAYPSVEQIDLVEMQRNTIDPIKMVFDIVNLNSSMEEWIINEQIRQQDKTINNTIGEFHQKLLGKVDGWENLCTGHETGCDLRKTDNTIFIELKNKWNTTNSGSLSVVRNKLEEVISQFPNATAYWAYTMPKTGGSGEEVWVYDHQRNPRIKKIWGKKVYELVTGDRNALKNTWKALPMAINEIKGTDYNFTEQDNQKLLRFFGDAFGN